MAKHFNTWTPGEKNGLRDPYWKGWDIWRYPISSERRKAIDITKVPSGLFYKGLFYLNYILYAKGEVDIPRTQKQMGRELKRLFGVSKCICIVEAQKVFKSANRYVSVQFYARMKTRPEDEKMLQVPQAAENGIVLWEPEEED